MEKYCKKCMSLKPLESFVKHAECKGGYTHYCKQCLHNKNVRIKPEVVLLPGEEWRDAKGFEGIYQVSNFGRVKALERDIDAINRKLKYQEQIMLPYICNGYYRVVLSKSNKRRKEYVHRLVAEAFLPNPNNYPEINHKDSNKLNPSESNLEWCTPRQNIIHKAQRTKKHTGAFFKKKRNKWVASIRIEHKSIELGAFNTPEEASQEYFKKVATL